jgi:hypothetical protein
MEQQRQSRIYSVLGGSHVRPVALLNLIAHSMLSYHPFCSKNRSCGLENPLNERHLTRISAFQDMARLIILAWRYQQL